MVTIVQVMSDEEEQTVIVIFLFVCVHPIPQTNADIQTAYSSTRAHH